MDCYTPQGLHMLRHIHLSTPRLHASGSSGNFGIFAEALPPQAGGAPSCVHAGTPGNLVRLCRPKLPEEATAVRVFKTQPLHRTHDGFLQDLKVGEPVNAGLKHAHVNTCRMSVLMGFYDASAHHIGTV